MEFIFGWDEVGMQNPFSSAEWNCFFFFCPSHVITIERDGLLTLLIITMFELFLWYLAWIFYLVYTCGTLMAKLTSILHSFLYLYLFHVSSPFLLSRSGVCFLAPLIWAALVICFDWECGGSVSASSEPRSLESFHSQNPATRRTHLAYLAGEWENIFRRALFLNSKWSYTSLKSANLKTGRVPSQD